MIGIVLWILDHYFFFLTLTIHHMNLTSPFFQYIYTVVQHLVKALQLQMLYQETFLFSTTR